MEKKLEPKDGPVGDGIRFGFAGILQDMFEAGIEPQAVDRLAPQTMYESYSEFSNTIYSMREKWAKVHFQG